MYICMYTYICTHLYLYMYVFSYLHSSMVLFSCLTFKPHLFIMHHIHHYYTITLQITDLHQCSSPNKIHAQRLYYTNICVIFRDF